MQIKLNGEDFEVNDGTSLTALIEKLGLNPKSVAVERNLEIVPKSLHAVTKLCSGDRIEIVEFVGGG
ncbi:MAG: thiamine biosynthesis protein ThiS [Ponticaulis sp.]|nr:thiamine biosynthesis protein ThiS [Ponticaulis sp.]